MVIKELQPEFQTQLIASAEALDLAMSHTQMGNAALYNFRRTERERREAFDQLLGTIAVTEPQPEFRLTGEAVAIINPHGEVRHYLDAQPVPAGYYYVVKAGEVTIRNKKDVRQVLWFRPSRYRTPTNTYAMMLTGIKPATEAEVEAAKAERRRQARRKQAGTVR